MFCPYIGQVCRRHHVKVSWVGRCVPTALVIGKRKFCRRGREKHCFASSLSLLNLRLTGDSSTYLDRLHFSEHVNLATYPINQTNAVILNLDTLRTRAREAKLLQECLGQWRSFLVDNTNVSRAGRARYLPVAGAAGYRCIGYVFEATIGPALERNAGRARVVPAAGSKVERSPVAVCGAHLEGLALHHQLAERGTVLGWKGETAAGYRLFAMPRGGGLPPRPVLRRDETGGGAAIAVEVWELEAAAFLTYVAEIPAPLGIGKVELATGEQVPGFIAEPRAMVGAEEITAFGGWRA